MLSLQQTRNIEVFSHPAIQMVIVHMWNKYWRDRSMWIILFPLALQILIFTTWSCCYLPNKENANETLGLVLEIISFSLACYFMIIEIISSYGLCGGKIEF